VSEKTGMKVREKNKPTEVNFLNFHFSLCFSGLGWSLASQDLDRNGATVPFVEFLWRQGKLEQPLFSLNLFDQTLNPEASSSSTLTGGRLTIGGIQEELYYGDIAYSPVVAESQFYTKNDEDPLYPSTWKANVQAVSSNGVGQGPISSYDAYFSMGSTYSTFPADVFQNIVASIPRQYSTNFFNYDDDPGEYAA